MYGKISETMMINCDSTTSNLATVKVKVGTKMPKAYIGINLEYLLTNYMDVILSNLPTQNSHYNY